MKKVLFVLRKPPHSGAFVQEALDVILTTAAFDLPTSLLLLDDAVFQLKSGQQPEVFGLKDTASIFHALEIYDVKHIYAEAESLSERGLKPADLCLPVQTVYRKNVGELLRRHQVLFSY